MKHLKSNLTDVYIGPIPQKRSLADNAILVSAIWFDRVAAGTDVGITAETASPDADTVAAASQAAPPDDGVIRSVVLMMSLL
jgi:hypothetical protein